MKSPGGNYSQPNIPAPTGAPIGPPGSSPATPSYVNFLTPNQVTTSINPTAMAQIAAMGRPPAPPVFNNNAAQMPPDFANMRNQLMQALQNQAVRQSIQQGGMRGPMTAMIAQASGNPRYDNDLTVYRQNE